MISYIKGELVYSQDGTIIIENNGIGYSIQVSEETSEKIKNKKGLIKIYIYMNVKDDGISLFGFLSFEELRMFNLLITVSGVGPKGALSILSVLPPNKLALAIITDDIKELLKGPGIGKKTAQRIVLELKDKIKTEDALSDYLEEDEENLEFGTSEMNDDANDAVEALTGLGFGRSEAVKTVMAVGAEGKTSEQIIKQALKRLSRQ